VSRRRISRRRFLAEAAALGGFPLVVPGSALGLSGATAPGNRITVAQVGLGWIGETHLNAMLGRTDVHYVAVCDINRQRAEAVRDRINRHYAERSGAGAGAGCDATGDFREVLARADLDAVIVATPDHGHGPIACAAARAGKDVYCEKPLSLTIREGREIVETVNRYGTVFQTGSQQRSNSFGPFRSAAELVRNGRIGKVVSVDVSTGDPPKPCDLPAEDVPGHIDWDAWVGQAPWRPYHAKLVDKAWRPYREFCAGGFGDMGAHHFDIAQWAMDMDTSGPVEVLAPDPSAARPRVSFRYANGSLVNHVSGNCLGLTFTGTEGRLYIGRDGFWTDPASLKGEPLGPGDLRLYDSRDHHGNWLSCIRTRTACVADAETGHRTATVCHLGNIVYELGRSLTWDPAQEMFPGDEEANRLLGRSRRAACTV
jgi:predicted dehydrogenase